MSKRCRAKTVPIWANCTSQSGWTSALAPASSSTVGPEPGTGIGVAIAGRLTPLIRPMRSNAAAIVAPVLPAESIALAVPSRTASAARTRVESFLRRTPWAGSSCISMTSLAGISGSPPRSTRSPRSSGPTSATGVPAAAAVLAPATMVSGAWSPPMASTATGSIGEGVARQATSTAMRFLYQPQLGHTVCGVFALPHRGQRATGRRAELPRAGATAAGLRLRLLLLRNGHRWLPRQVGPEHVSG